MHQPPLRVASSETGSRLGRIVLAYLVMLIAILTLSPFRFSLSAIRAFSFRWEWFDTSLNVVMFVPIGFIYQLSTRRTKAGAWVRACLIGAGLSLVVECGQMLIPGRVSSYIDVFSNTAGAGIGALIAAASLARQSGAEAVRTFAVELPLMGIVYLLIPLAWLTALGDAGTSRTWLAILPAACAGWIIGAAFTSFDKAPVWRVVFATSVWAVIALVPATTSSPIAALVAAAVAVAACAARATAPALLTHERDRQGASRRFEATTLRFVLPVLWLYVVLAALSPPFSPREEWLGTFALLPPGRGPTNAAIARLLDHIVGFTVIGYTLAEYGGRVRDQFRTIVPRVVAIAAAVSTGLEYARGWHWAHAASASLFVLTLGGAAFGSWLYLLQLAHIRALTGDRAPAGEASASRPFSRAFPEEGYRQR